jgi:hypothetical protein
LNTQSSTAWIHQDEKKHAPKNLFYGVGLNQLEPFTLSLSKRRAGLGQAEPERIFQVQRCRLNKNPF